VQLGADPPDTDDERLPLSPREVTPQALATAPSKPAHRRGSSIFRALTEDFSINLKETGKQISNVAEHPAPPFAFPMAPGAAAGVGAGAAESSSAAGRHVQKSKRSDLEMGALPSAAAGGVALSPSRKPPARVASTGSQDNPFAGGGLMRASITSDGSDGVHRAFGGRDMLSDDDPMSPTWDEPSGFDGASARGAPRSTAKAFLQTLSPRQNPHRFS